MSWGDGHKRGLPAGLDTFEARQQPDVDLNADDVPPDELELAKFAMDRIREQEAVPRTDGVARIYYETHGAMVHRYAADIRRDMVAFRRIVAQFVLYASMPFYDEVREGLQYSVRAIVNRWSDHPDFRDEWRLG